MKALRRKLPEEIQIQIVLAVEQLRQLGDIRHHPPRLVFREQLGCGTAAGTDLALVTNSAA